MFQLDNIYDKKTEWNIKENHIITPLVNDNLLSKETDKIIRTVNIIPEDGDQNSPTGDMENGLVIGFGKNLFETQNTKSDLLIIQDSDLKLLSCNPDLKNQFGYPPSLVNQNKNETSLENLGLKGRLKKRPHDNAAIGVTDILIYDEKAGEKINLNNMEKKSKFCVTKFREDTRREESTAESLNEKNVHLIINYIQKGYSISPKGNIECETLVDNIQNNKNENTFKKVLCDNDVDMPTSNFIGYKVEVDKNTSQIHEDEQKNLVFPEKSLPLKKKAKMKKTMVCFDNQRSLLKQELIKNRQLQDKSSFENKDEELQSSFEQEDSNVSDFEKSLFNQINKRQKMQSQKLNKMAVTSLVQNSTTEKPVKFKKKSINIDLLEFDITKFKNIYDLVEGLRKFQMISIPFWQMLNKGLKEMNVDILKEIIKKRNEPQCKNYSPQLKAFAFFIHFKQPVVFNFLAKVCKEGWPSLNVIKEWKLQLNSHQRPNFVGVQRKTEDDIS